MLKIFNKTVKISNLVHMTRWNIWEQENKNTLAG
jgi:hypothetical protein